MIDNNEKHLKNILKKEKQYPIDDLEKTKMELEIQILQNNVSKKNT